MDKAVMAISNHGDMLGGGEHSFIDLVSHLPDQWNVLAVVPGKGEVANRLMQAGIETAVAPLPSIRPWRAPDILSSIRTYYNLCRKHQPLLIYANGSRATVYGGIVGRILNLPVVWHCRIADSDKYLDFILKRLSSRIVANSRATANRFKSPFHSKVRVVHNGVDIAWLRDDSVPRPGLIGDAWKVILVVARVSRWKRHDLALRAFERIAKADLNLHLVCVGSSDALDSGWWEHLQNRSRGSTVSNRIHWVGQVEDIRPWYRAAYVLLLCSENEPFGRVLVEAMACGVPVVATRSGGVPEIVRHHEDGILVTSGSVDEMAIAMNRILKDDLLRERLALSAQKHSDDFSLDLYVAKMTHIFEKTVGN